VSLTRRVVAQATFCDFNWIHLDLPRSVAYVFEYYFTHRYHQRARTREHARKQEKDRARECTSITPAHPALSSLSPLTLCRSLSHAHVHTIRFNENKWSDDPSVLSDPASVCVFVRVCSPYLIISSTYHSCKGAPSEEGFFALKFRLVIDSTNQWYLTARSAAGCLNDWDLNEHFRSVG